eukprot:CAMPEP_0170549002 /NCGR_PEP_ID=MMETSP0211-20121228/7178_1 /TAXON_ID=311385 /ORGANISM="Pseudokeronopsis sp., Strain OXSARD2" /LENGTH=63 /DNA_ID=CAMNT_0010854759 /DNA_START=452 /DNA_END=643 /DNA_ORIENTATION=-
MTIGRVLHFKNEDCSSVYHWLLISLMSILIAVLFAQFFFKFMHAKDAYLAMRKVQMQEMKKNV